MDFWTKYSKFCQAKDITGKNQNKMSRGITRGEEEETKLLIRIIFIEATP